MLQHINAWQPSTVVDCVVCFSIISFRIVFDFPKQMMLIQARTKDSRGKH